MNAEFNWWLLIVGLVVGAGLVWLVVADSRRREADITETEREGEAQWIAAAMTDAGRPVADDDVLDILRLHAEYLGAAPPDDASDAALAAPPDDASDAALAPPIAAGPSAPAPARDAGTAARPDSLERRTMAHPIGPDRPDREGGPA